MKLHFGYGQGSVNSERFIATGLINVPKQHLVPIQDHSFQWHFFRWILEVSSVETEEYPYENLMPLPVGDSGLFHKNFLFFRKIYSLLNIVGAKKIS